MSNSNLTNNLGQENYRGRSYNEKSNFRDRSGGRRDGGGFRIRLSDNEMKAVKLIQETFQLRSTVAVLGFSVRTLSEMLKDEKLIESIKEYAKNNKNPSPNRQSQNAYEEKKKTVPDPFARPFKNSSNEKIQSSEVEEDDK
tara:strand:+ start:65 stop:487 length:423 start_codon:yes stop_codon:yes gene_type:complete